MGYRCRLLLWRDARPRARVGGECSLRSRWREGRSRDGLTVRAHEVRLIWRRGPRGLNKAGRRVSLSLSLCNSIIDFVDMRRVCGAMDALNCLWVVAVDKDGQQHGLCSGLRDEIVFKV